MLQRLLVNQEERAWAAGGGKGLLQQELLQQELLQPWFSERGFCPCMCLGLAILQVRLRLPCFLASVLLFELSWHTNPLPSAPWPGAEIQVCAWSLS